jgi:hypothetical protein
LVTGERVADARALAGAADHSGGMQRLEMLEVFAVDWPLARPSSSTLR